MSAEVDYLPHVVTFFARASEKRHEPYFLPRALKNHIKVVILRLEWYKI